MAVGRGMVMLGVGALVLIGAAGRSWGAEAPPPAGKPEAAKAQPQDDKSYLVTGRNYTALVDAEGNLRSLKIDGREVLSSAPPHKGAAFPGKEPAAGVSAAGNTIVAVNKAIRVRYVFCQTGIDVATEGDALLPQLTGITAAISDSGQASDGKAGIADVCKIVFGKATMGLSTSFHVISSRLTPSPLCGRGGKPEDKFAYHVEFGIPVEPAEMLGTMTILAVGRPARKTPEYKKGEPVVFEAATENLGDAQVAGEVRFVIRQEWARGKIVKESSRPVKVSGREMAVFRSAAEEVAEPGIYWASAEFRAAEKTYKQAGMGFLYEGARYTPALTRPADFREFWDRKLKEMRAVAFDAKLTESPAKSTQASVHYDLEITIAPGKRIATCLRLPREPGKHDAEVVSYWGSDTQEKILQSLAGLEAQKPGVGMWERGPDRIRVGAPQPEDCTYTRWAGRDDNNMLDSYLVTVRMTDYLRSRDDVAGIYLFGASRSGPIMIATAALDPARIVAVNVHVPTSTGISWPGNVYRGWGGRTDPPVAAYFDAVNFAPDLAVPLLVDGGISDDLAYAPGILAMFNGAEKCPWKRLSIEPGGHGFFPNPSRPQMEKELAEYLKARPAPPPIGK